VFREVCHEGIDQVQLAGLGALDSDLVQVGP
jgi:hypothetical protein